MRNKDEDRRIIKTRQVIQDALFSLMQEKPYNKITIQEIIDRANVGRSTFYSHYETKEELLLNCINNLLENLNCFIKNYMETEEGRQRLLPVDELFDHIRENSKIMKGLMKTDSSELFFDKVQNSWNQNICEYLQSRLPEGTKPKVPLELLSNHITGSLMNLLKWWFNNKMPYTSAQMDQYFQELINPCIDAIMKR